MGALLPESLPEFLPCHDFAVLLKKQGEDSKGLFLKFNPNSLPSQGSGR
jgi:hypothetical protein